MTAPVTTTVDALLSDDLRLRAELTPDDLCWIMGERAWTWGSAWHDVQRLAGALADAGVRRGDRIGFLSRNQPAILMAMHAGSLIGAADVVLDPRSTPDELAHVLAHADLRLLFVEHDLTSSVSSLGAAAPVRVVVGGAADEWDAMIDSGEPLGQQPGVTPDDPCVIVCSSGTTGRPKGIVLTQHNLITHTRNAVAALECGPGDRVLLSNVMFHSSSLLVAASGATGIVEPDLMPDSLLDALERGLTHACLTPAAIGRLERAGLLEPFEQLAHVVYGAAPMPPHRIRAAMAAWPSTRFVQVYGFTEGVGVLTLLDDAEHRDDTRPHLRSSCGRPISGVEARVVVPETGAEAPRGTRGELCFRTEQTMAGYLGDRATTREMVTDDGWVRSGDLGRIDHDGYVFVEDRLKDIVLVNGWNVAPAEVERVLEQHPAVLEAAVIGVPDEQLGEAIEALVTARPGDVVDPDDIVEFCRTRLAEHKVPASITVVDDFPRNTRGKIVKRVLREPYWAASGRRI